MAKTKVRKKKRDVVSNRPFDLKNDPSPFEVEGADSVGKMSEDQLVRFLPCSYVPSRCSQMGFWVRHKKSHEYTEKVEWKFKTHSVTHMDCPDREILMVTDANQSDQYRPLNGSWDKFVSLSLTHDCSNDNEFDRIMINPHQLTKADMAMNWKGVDTPNKTSLLVNSDSGGFQLRAGTTDFIDPEHLAQFYNNNVDEGFTLDIPCAGMGEKLSHACARIQNRNSLYLKENLDENIRLGNIIHGLERTEMQRYRNWIEDYDHDFDLVSIPSSMSLPAIKQIDRVAFMLCTGYQYPQFHQLGLYTISSTLATVWLAHQMKRAGRTLLFTNDASTAHQSARFCVWHSNALFNKPIERLLMSNELPDVAGREQNPYKTLNCQCYICSNLKYADTLSQRHEVTKWALVRHNESDYTKWLKMMNIYARDLDFQSYLDLSKSITSGGQRANTIKALEYVEALMQDGYEKTHKRFSHLTQAMFDGGYEDTEGLWEGDNIIPEKLVSETNLIREKRLSKVVSRYAKYYS